MRHQFLPRLLALTVLGTVGLAPFNTRAEDKLSGFMKRKLAHAEKVLEGLATEDFELIAKNSQAMSLLCEDEMWAVLQTPEYRERSGNRGFLNCVQTH